MLEALDLNKLHGTSRRIVCTAANENVFAFRMGMRSWQPEIACAS